MAHTVVYGLWGLNFQHETGEPGDSRNIGCRVGFRVQGLGLVCVSIYIYTDR